MKHHFVVFDIGDDDDLWLIIAMIMKGIVFSLFFIVTLIAIIEMQLWSIMMCYP